MHMPEPHAKSVKSTLLTIIIVSYNTKQLTLDALDSAARDCQRSSLLDGKSNIIVVDNHSQDDSLQALKAYARASSVPVTLIANTQNVGFARANNQAIRQATTSEFILLLNSDAYVQPGALEKLVTSFLEYEQDELNWPLGMVAATLINQDGTLQPQGGDLPSLLSLAYQMLLLDDLPLLGQFTPSIQHTGRRATRRVQTTSTSTELVRMGWVGGTAVCLSTEMLQNIGLLDEEIFMYAEDIELCMRAHNHHWLVTQHPSSRITHFGQQSSSSQQAINGEIFGLLYIWSKHMPLWQVGPARLLIQVGLAIRAVLFSVLPGKRSAARVYADLLAKLTES